MRRYDRRTFLKLSGASALLLGVTGGYPLGADAVARLRRSGAEQHLQ